ncbi:hypothetical protein K1X76_05505 [bacterium]|nr:hypothetical protein [bacterium]
MSRTEELKQISSLETAKQQIALAAILADEFKKYKIPLTVVGGAAVQFYTDAQYTTHDVDAILYGDDSKTVDLVMNSLGFKRTSSYRHFEHPDFPFVVEFPPSPIEVGFRHISEVNLIKMGEYAVQVIKVEDIIMDRIIAGVEWKSSHHLDQARLLWTKNKKHIDKKYLTEFAKQEGYLDTLEEIKKPAPKMRKRGVKK